MSLDSMNTSDGMSTRQRTPIRPFGRSLMISRCSSANSAETRNTASTAIPIRAGLKSIKRTFTGTILMDFRSPRRPLPGIQDYFNRKGLISDQGEKKAAFYILQKAYKEAAIGKAE